MHTYIHLERARRQREKEGESKGRDSKGRETRQPAERWGRGGRKNAAEAVKDI